MFMRGDQVVFALSRDVVTPGLDHLYRNLAEPPQGNAAFITDLPAQVSQFFMHDLPRGDLGNPQPPGQYLDDFCGCHICRGLPETGNCSRKQLFQ